MITPALNNCLRSAARWLAHQSQPKWAAGEKFPTVCSCSTSSGPMLLSSLIWPLLCHPQSRAVVLFPETSQQADGGSAMRCERAAEDAIGGARRGGAWASRRATDHRLRLTNGRLIPRALAKSGTLRAAARPMAVTHRPPLPHTEPDCLAPGTRRRPKCGVLFLWQPAPPSTLISADVSPSLMSGAPTRSARWALLGIALFCAPMSWPPKSLECEAHPIISFCYTRRCSLSTSCQELAFCLPLS